MGLYDSRKQNQSAFNILIAWFILSHDELGKFFFYIICECKSHKCSDQLWFEVYMDEKRKLKVGKMGIGFK